MRERLPESLRLEDKDASVPEAGEIDGERAGSPPLLAGFLLFFEGVNVSTCRMLTNGVMLSHMATALANGWR